MESGWTSSTGDRDQRVVMAFPPACSTRKAIGMHSYNSLSYLEEKEQFLLKQQTSEQILYSVTLNPLRDIGFSNYPSIHCYRHYHSHHHHKYNQPSYLHHKISNLSLDAVFGARIHEDASIFQSSVHICNHRPYVPASVGAITIFLVKR